MAREIRISAQVGDEVHHPVHGPGRIRALLDGGRRWRVVFASAPGLPRTLPADELSSVHAESLPVLRIDAPAPALRQALEALRLGVVPIEGIEALTVGRDAEIARIREMVDGARGLLLLSGAYGSGKTHLIEIAEARALAANLLVARATFDPEETPPSHPLRLYRALLQGLRYPDGPGRGLVPLLERLVGSRDHVTPGTRAYHRYFSPVLWALAHHPMDADLDDLLSFVQGQLTQANDDANRALAQVGWKGSRLLALPDYRTFGQIMGYLLGGIACWARDAGYRGLLVLLDEAEYLDQLEATSRDMATNVLRYLAMGTLDRTSLAFAPEAVYRGGQDVHRQIPAVFAPDQPLAALCAFTPHPAITRVLQDLVSDPRVIVPLEALPSWELARLADHIFVLYRQAWPRLDPPEEHRRAVTGRLSGAFRRGEVETTRQAARLVVEFWDLYRHRPERALAALGS